MRHAFVLGDRADDMRLRLKYADAEEEDIEKVADNAALIEKLKKSTVPVFILPNYTSMLSLGRRSDYRETGILERLTRRGRLSYE